jgi:pimeloyl-ACP methyl ester carboxylesterase
MSLAPFKRPPYETIPAVPRLPHPFFSLAEERVTVRTPHFGSTTLSMRRMGKGPKLVCVHGLMTSSYSFRYLLEPASANHEVIVFDLPGAGRSDAPDVSYGPQELADLIGAFLQEVGAWGGPVIANSMGGYLAMWLVLRQPKSIGRLVNLHSPGLPTARMWALQAALGLPGANVLLDRLVARDPKRWAFRNVHYYDESLKSLEEAEEYGAPLSRPEGRRAFHRYLSDTMRASTMRDFERELRKEPFPIPLQLVYARRDPMVPPIIGNWLARLVPAAELVWLDGASHFAHVDATSAFAAVALPFLDRAS